MHTECTTRGAYVTKHHRRGTKVDGERRYPMGGQPGRRAGRHARTHARTDQKTCYARPRKKGSEDIGRVRAILTWMVASRFDGLAFRMTKTSSGKKSSAPALFPFSCRSSISVVQHCRWGCVAKRQPKRLAFVNGKPPSLDPQTNIKGT